MPEPRFLGCRSPLLPQAVPPNLPPAPTGTEAARAGTAVEARYQAMARIRRFEEMVLDRFSSGVFHGTTHTYIGQEADAVGVLETIDNGVDLAVSNHRCHGHFLAYGGDMTALFAELMGREAGVCGGLGGSQHLHWRGFYSNGILGGTLPLAVGLALGERQAGRPGVTVVFTGDGAMGEGVVYESLNLASLWKAPVLFVVENNQVAQTTPVHLGVAGDLAARFAAFAIPTDHLDTSDVAEVAEAAAGRLGEVRAGAGPRALVVDTRRFGPHSKSDDPRPASEVALMRAERDPLTIAAARLDPASRATIDRQVDSEVQAAFAAAASSPAATLGRVA
ncbi:MAG: thiamine pyrophosphate-dependent dehydrogenase E1 component subunit alpha [Acidimicrobiales bacterium]